MPYFPYGFPRVLCSSSGGSPTSASSAPAPPDDGGSGSGSNSWVHVQQHHGFLLAVSEEGLQLWSAGLHKLRLGQAARTAESVQAEGRNVAAFWCGSKGLVAVLVGAPGRGSGRVCKTAQQGMHAHGCTCLHARAHRMDASDLRAHARTHTHGRMPAHSLARARTQDGCKHFARSRSYKHKHCGLQTHIHARMHPPPQTSLSCLHIYSTSLSREPLLPGLPCAASAAPELCKADIALRHVVCVRVRVRV